MNRPEEVECTVDSVDDSAGRSIVTLDAYDIAYRLGRECTIQTSFGGAEPCLCNSSSTSNLYIILATTTWIIYVQYQNPPHSY